MERQTWEPAGGGLGAFPVIEFRRYAVQAAERDAFARYFETYFPEAFQQLGAMFLGHFMDRGDPTGFVWIRGFHDMDQRAAINQAFYDGPLWKEHASTMNDRMLNHTNVLLLRPLTAERGIPVLPAVDAMSEHESPRGIILAQLFPVKPGGVDAFAREAEEHFARYRAAGAREAGVLVTLDVPNNFPRLPVRTDGPYLLWLGVLPDDAALEQRFKPAAARAAEVLSMRNRVRGEPELLVLNPAHRSRLRWLP